MRRFARNTDYAVLPEGDGEVGRLRHVCAECGEEHFLDVGAEKLKLWLDGRVPGHVQDFWLEVPAPEREEFFLSGVCGRCWDRMFKED